MEIGFPLQSLVRSCFNGPQESGRAHDLGRSVFSGAREINCLLDRPLRGRASSYLSPGRGVLRPCKDSKLVRREAEAYLGEAPPMLKLEVKESGENKERIKKIKFFEKIT